MRGIDTEGQVANFVETEQIVQYEGNKCSYVQVILHKLLCAILNRFNFRMGHAVLYLFLLALNAGN